MDAKNIPWIIMGFLVLSSIILLIIGAFQEFQVMGVWIGAIGCFVMALLIGIGNTISEDLVGYSDNIP